MERNPSISLRSGDKTANFSMEIVNVENITAYFDLLKEVYYELQVLNTFITRMKPERHLSNIYHKLLPRKGAKKSDIIEHLVRKLKL